MSNITPNLKLNKYGGNLGLLADRDRHALEDANLDAIDQAVGSAGSGPIQVATVTLTSAQIKTLHSSPVQILPAPGVGKAYAVVGSFAHYKFGTTGYAGNNALFIGPATTAQGWAVAFTPGFYDQTHDTFASGFGEATGEANYANAPMFIFPDVGDPTLGDGTIVVTVFYSIIDLS